MAEVPNHALRAQLFRLGTEDVMKVIESNSPFEYADVPEALRSLLLSVWLEGVARGLEWHLQGISGLHAPPPDD